MFEKIKKPLDITFLGTGTSQGVPVVACNCAVCASVDEKDKRLRSSVLVRANGKVLIIDTGPDFRQQMLREKVQRLDAVLVTHEHKDHVAGLDDVRAFNFSMQKAMELYAEKRVMDSIKREFAYIFSEDKYPGVPEINAHLIDNHIFRVDGLPIVPVRAFHYRLPVLGFRIGDFAYITDTNRIPEEEHEKLIGLDVLVVNALRKKKHLSHFNLEEAVEMIEILKPKRAYLTHISHMMGLHQEVQKELPAHIFLAYDGLSVRI
jgi:phosphoribosyl 1,2-cyclic phosphate phosphodiesterase